jgi:5'-nucleotidase
MPVAFIGLVLKETPTIVTPSGVAGVAFLDEAEAANKYVPELKKKGVRAIVVTIHQGTNQAIYEGPTHPAAEDIGGSIGPIISELDDEIDIVVSGHWHRFTNAIMENKNGKQILVTQAFSAGTAYADIEVAVDPKSKDIVEKSAAIITTYGDEGPGLTPNPKVAAMVEKAAAVVEPLVNRIIVQAATDIVRMENEAAESALGNLIADAQRAAMSTDIAFMNPGGIRADISAGQVTWGNLFTVQPFNNDLVKMELSGQQIVDLLNQQWAGQPFARVMKPSGIGYTWDGNGTADHTDDHVVVNSIKVGGSDIDLAATYTVTVNSFMAAGGDNYTVLPQGTNRVVGPVDLDALVNYVSQLPQPINYNIEGRIQRIN